MLKEIACDFGLLGRLELWQGRLAEYWHTFRAVFEPSGTRNLAFMVEVIM